MDKKEDLKNILTKMTNGDISKALYFMKSCTKTENMKILNNKPSMHIMINLTHIIVKPELKDKLSPYDIKDLIILCCTNISNPSESEINNYIRSLFHLINYLSEKMSLKDLTELCEFAFPAWISSKELTENIYSEISHLIALVNNIIISFIKTKETELLLKCIWIHLKLLKYTFPKNPKLLFSKIEKYCIFQKGFKPEYFRSFWLDVCSLLEDVENLSDVDIGKDIYSIFLSTITSYFPNSIHNFEESRPDIEKAFTILEKFCKVSPEYISCIDIFKSFYNLTVRKLNEFKSYDLILLKDLRINCETLLKTYGSASSVITTFYYIPEIFRYMLPYFEKCDEHLWITYMKPEIQKEFMKLLILTGQVLTKKEYSDKCSKICSAQAFIITSISGRFLNTSLRYKCENLEDLHKIALVSMKDSCKCIETLKRNQGKNWLTNWHVLAAILYNITNRLYTSENYKLANVYNKILCTHIILLEGIENKNSFTENSLGICLNLMALCYMKMKQYRSALTYIALSIQVCPNLHTKAWLIWCNAKADANHNNVGNVAELTIRNVLEIDADIIKRIYPNYMYQVELMENLLYLELQNYHKIWASKIPMNNTCKEFFKYSNDLVKKTLVLSLIWEKVICLQDEDFMANVESTMKAFKKQNNLTSQLCLSVLYYIEFQYKTYDVVKRNLAEMNEAVKEEKSTPKPYEEHNPNDKCDVVPTYYNNKIENNMKLHKIQNSSIELWHKILENKQLKTIKSLMEELHIDILIKQTALEYRLQNYRFQMIKIWFLYLQYGKLFDKKDIIVTSIGFILESINCENETAQDMVKLAEKYVKQLITSNDKTCLETIATYYINKSTGFLQSNLLEKGVQELYKAEKYFESQETNSCNIIKARILFLKCLYLQKPCAIKLTKHDKNFIALAQNAFSMIVDFYKSGANKCLYTLSLLFDISLFIGNMYKWLKMPREIRCYTYESVLLAQQMVLPLRTIQFFSLLAFTDLLGCQFDDCRVKISGIDYMLCLQNTSVLTKNIMEPMDQEKIVEVSMELEKLSITKRSSGIETMLDVPFDHKIKNFQGSPILQSKPFKIPSFIYHLDCNCSYCLNLDYLRLILECTHLEALFYLRQSNLQCSSDFFRGGLKLYNYILKKYVSLDSNLFSELINQFKKELVFTYCKLQFDYSFYYVQKREYDEALKIIDDIFLIMGDDIKLNSYFYSEILLHKIHIISAKEFKQIEQTKDNKNELEVDYDVFLSKTPENKISVPKFSVSVSPCEDPTPKKHIKKNIIFELFPSDDEREQKSPEVKSKVYKMKIPTKTPAPSVSKLKIYTSGNVSKQNKIQPLCMSVSPISNENNKPKTNVLMSPADPQSKIKTRKMLEKRTKLLTEKLKSEKKPVLKELNYIKEIPDESKVTKKVQKENVRNITLRKNLTDDLKDSESNTVHKDLKENIKIKVSNKPIKKEPTKIVKKDRPQRYKRIIENSTSSEDSPSIRNTRSLSKI